MVISPNGSFSAQWASCRHSKAIHAETAVATNSRMTMAATSTRRFGRSQHSRIKPTPLNNPFKNLIMT
jgi:hypothetical protein